MKFSLELFKLHNETLTNYIFYKIKNKFSLSKEFLFSFDKVQQFSKQKNLLYFVPFTYLFYSEE